jgi:hypothetical protein
MTDGEPDIDSGRRLHRWDVQCPACGNNHGHYITDIDHTQANLRCGSERCRHRWTWTITQHISSS